MSAEIEKETLANWKTYLRVACGAGRSRAIFPRHS